jgi:hypothetical protein
VARDRASLIQSLTRTSLRKHLGRDICISIGRVNLSTYKYHAPEDYPDICNVALLLISTQGELQHKMIKHRIAHTNKRKYTGQLAAAEVHKRFMQHVEQRIISCARLSQSANVERGTRCEL